MYLLCHLVENVCNYPGGTTVVRFKTKTPITDNLGVLLQGSEYTGQCQCVTHVDSLSTDRQLKIDHSHIDPRPGCLAYNLISQDISQTIYIP